MWNCLPVSTSASANGSAQARITPAAITNSNATTWRRRRVLAGPPMSSAGPTRCGSSAGRGRCGTCTRRTAPTSTTASNSAERVAERQGQAVEGRRGAGTRAPPSGCARGAPRCCRRGAARRAATSGPSRFTRHAATSTTADQPSADEQLVRAGHVGEREAVRRLARRRARLPREHEVDRVLGQHRDQGEQGEGEAGRDVELHDFRRPGQHERGADDRERRTARRPASGAARRR